jgi:hypothetical protein
MYRHVLDDFEDLRPAKATQRLGCRVLSSTLRYREGNANLMLHVVRKRSQILQAGSDPC